MTLIQGRNRRKERAAGREETVVKANSMTGVATNIVEKAIVARTFGAARQRVRLANE